MFALILGQSIASNQCAKCGLWTRFWISAHMIKDPIDIHRSIDDFLAALDIYNKLYSVGTEIQRVEPTQALIESTQWTLGNTQVNIQVSPLTTSPVSGFRHLGVWWCLASGTTKLETSGHLDLLFNCNVRILWFIRNHWGTFCIFTDFSSQTDDLHMAFEQVKKVLRNNIKRYPWFAEFEWIMQVLVCNSGQF